MKLLESLNVFTFGLRLCWHHLLVRLFEETVLFTSKRVYGKHFMTKLCNHYPMVTLHIAGLRVNKSKGAIVKSWNIIRKELSKVLILE